MIYLDNQEVEFHADSIGSAITTAKDVLGSQGRVVVEVRAETQTVSKNWPNPIFPKPTPGTLFWFIEIQQH